MNSHFPKYWIKKVSLIACLFLFPFIASAQEWQFDPKAKKAYDLVLNLRTEEAFALLNNPETTADYYILSLAETLELMVSEDGLKFNEYEDRFQARLDKKFKSPGNDVQFLEAEMHLHWAFIYLKFGHEFDAALHLRQAFQIADECRKKSPDYLPIKKTIGLLEIMIGSVPEKYGWILGLLGINGSIEGGLNSLNLVKTSKSPFAFEADLLYSIIQGFILQQPQIGLEELKKVIKSNPDNNLLLFLAGSLAIKNSESETALTFLDSINADHGLPLYYADYLKGEVFLHKGQYLNSISSYHWFIDHYKGQNYIKDAYYKIALCHWLNGNKNEALILFKNARSKGKEATEADKYAARSLADNELPNVKLSKARYATDGGYYEQARQILSEILPAEIPHQRDQVEFYYRKARLAHKTNQLPAARLFYLQTIEMADEKNWYFAPNAALQLGYISLAENNRKEAKGYFEKALTYKKHEYKNSIDSKAKTALAQIKRK